MRRPLVDAEVDVERILWQVTRQTSLNATSGPPSGEGPSPTVTNFKRGAPLHPLRLSVVWGGPQGHLLQRQPLTVPSGPLWAGGGSLTVPFTRGGPSPSPQALLPADPRPLPGAEAPHRLLGGGRGTPHRPLLLFGGRSPPPRPLSTQTRVLLRPFRPFPGSLPAGLGALPLPPERAQPRGPPPPPPRAAAAPAPPARRPPRRHSLRREL